MGKLDAIQRYLLIIRKVNSQPYLSLENMQQEVADELIKHGSERNNFSTRTLKRDIRDIRNELGIPILYSRSKNGYYFSEQEIWSPDNIERLLESFDILNSLNADTGLNCIVYPEKRFYRGTEHLLPLIKAIKGLHPIRFRYRKYNVPQASLRKVYPYAIKECRNRWYILGIEEGQSVLKTFGLDRLSHLEILPGKFRKDPSVDLTNKFRDLFGILDSPDLPVEKVVLSFNNRDGEYLTSLPLHPSQEILKNDPANDQFIIRLHIKITRDLVMELLSRSTSLKVIHPPHLKEEVYRIYLEALERNAPDAKTP